MQGTQDSGAKASGKRKATDNATTEAAQDNATIDWTSENDVLKAVNVDGMAVTFGA